MTVRHSIHIEAPLEKVFDFFKDPRNWQDTAPDGITYKDVNLVPGGVGTSYTWVARVGGMPVEGSDVFTEVVPNERITDESSRAFEGTWVYSFEKEGSGMRLTMEHHPRSVWRVPPLDRVGDGHHERVLHALKDRMEA